MSEGNPPPMRSIVPYETLVDKGLNWLSDKGVAVALLIGLASFFAYDKLFMQPGRDQTQRQHESEMQAAWERATDNIIDRIEKENERWRQAVLEAKFGKTETLQGLMRNGNG